MANSPRAHLLAFPGGQSPAGGYLDSLRLEGHGRRTDLFLDYHELRISAPPLLSERDGKPWEQVQGIYQPRRLYFREVNLIEGQGLPAHLEALPPGQPAPFLGSALAWSAFPGQNDYLFNVRLEAEPWLRFTAQNCRALERDGAELPALVSRDWSPPPLSPTRLVPNPRKLRQRYGGDPVTIHLDGRALQRQLFIGSVDIQGERRPDVHTVLNVGEEPSRWPMDPTRDRWENKGEGSQGMGVGEIAREAHWVIERLRAGQRLLVHCAAGMNRSATLCCAVLILLEGLSAEAALERLRQRHPWGKPDSFHWLALRWLAHTTRFSSASAPSQR